MTTSAVHRRRPRISTTSADATPWPIHSLGKSPFSPGRHGARTTRDGTLRAVAVPAIPTSRREGWRLRSRGRRLQDGRAIAPHCPFLMQGPSPVLTVPGGQASRWLVVLFEVPLAPAPLLLPRSPLVLPPATPGEELRPVAPVPWPALPLPLPWPALLLPLLPWPAANALPARPRLKPVTPAVPARPSARQETPATRSLRMDVLRSRTRTAERAPVRPSRAAVRTFSARGEATRRRRNGSADPARAFGRNRSIDPLPRRGSGTKEVIKAGERSPLPCRCPTYRKRLPNNAGCRSYLRHRLRAVRGRQTEIYIPSGRK